MRQKFSKEQFQNFEVIAFEKELPELITRVRLEYPDAFEGVSDNYIMDFARATHELSQKMGGLRDFDRVYDLVVLNAHADKIHRSKAGSAYFRSIVASDGITFNQKLDLLMKNLSRYFQRPS